MAPRRFDVWFYALWLGLLALAAGPSAAQAQGYADLGVVKPVVGCEALGKTDLSHVADTPATIQSATLIDTPKGQFCKIVGNIQPTIGFEVDLPVAHWTQRFLENGCGGLCGMTGVGINNAGTCGPALDGQFAIAGDDMGHKAAMGQSGEADFAADPQKRIDFAYRGNHATAVVAKALIHAFYGQAPRYSYFTGCSDGGREAMMEAERYPGDFDGISAGAPVMGFQVQNSFYHAWTVIANSRPDGSHILLAAKLPVLHAAVIAHCDALDGIVDGLLSDPRACKFDPRWVQCAPGAGDASQCLTAEEVAVVQKIYEGPTDAAGHRFTVGMPMPGSELQWFSFVPKKATDSVMSANMVGSMQSVLLADATPADKEVRNFTFDTDHFARVAALHPLFDSTNTDLKPFEQRGGKLIMWHGWSDTSVSPMISLAYYKEVQKELGKAQTDQFLRLFMLPGVGHCGGDGFSQVDTLSPLMAWVETQKAPTVLAADKVPDRMMGGPPPGAGGPGAAAGPGGAQAAGGPPAGGPPGGGQGGPPQGGAPGIMRAEWPYARAPEAPLATRAIYAFPLIPHYNGSGDPNAVASYTPAASPASEPATIDWYGSSLIGPDFQKTYEVRDGRLVVSGER